MGANSRVNGSETELKDSVFISIIMEESMKECGWQMNRMDSELRNGAMAAIMKAISKKA